MKRLLCLLLAVILVCGAVSLESVLAVESETTQEAEAQTGETEQESETESVEVDSESEETEPAAGGETEPSTNTEPDKYANRISGVLWIDANEDGTYDSGEQALADYPVCLYLEGDTDNAVETATTDADGKYIFEEITPGRYVVGIKAEENGTEYLLPLMGVQKDNKFDFTPDYSKVISNAIDIAEDMFVESIGAAMRIRPGIQTMANATYMIDITNSTTVTNSITTQFITDASIASNVLTFGSTVDSTDTYILTGTTTTVRIVVAAGVTVNIILSGANIQIANYPFYINSSANVNLTLDPGTTNVLKSTGIVNPGIYVPIGSTLTIDGTGSLEVVGNSGIGGIGAYGGLSGNITAEGAGTINIKDGEITATGGYGAGIGGGGGYKTASTASATMTGTIYGGSGGEVNISGGTVVATSSHGAGIGGGGGQGSAVGSANYNSGYVRGGSGGTLNISGGMVTATSSNYGAGIGGGGGYLYATSNVPGISYAGAGGTVNISGGTVIATGGSGKGAGIGGGGGAISYANCIFFGGSGGTVHITGGDVTATGRGNAGAGIGGGGTLRQINGTAVAATNDGGNITIDGGTVVAISGGGASGINVAGGAGIGGGGTEGAGSNAGSGGVITINGGNVTAIGNGNGPGIGGGSSGLRQSSYIGTTGVAGSAGTITINGGTVTATGGSRSTTTGIYAPGIGCGFVDSAGTASTAFPTAAGSIIFTGGSILPTGGNGGIVVQVNRTTVYNHTSFSGGTPTNGSTYGAPDQVHLVEFTGYSAYDPFHIVAGGTVSSYDYNANAHPDGTVYAWLVYPGVLTKDATNITVTTATLNGEVYLNNSYGASSGYFEWGTSSGNYISSTNISPTSNISGVDPYSVNISDLTADTRYYYRLVIVAGGMTVYGNEVTFQTPCIVTENYLKIGDGSTLQTAAISNVANGGSFTGSPPSTLTDSGNSYTYIGYSVGTPTTTPTTGVPIAIIISTNTNIYYYYAGPPIVTVSHTGASGTTTTLNGTYDLNGGTFTSGYFEIYDTATSSWITLTSTSAISITGATGVTAGTGQVDNSTTAPSITISGLTPGTTYQYRFTVTTNVGTDTATGSFTAGYGVTEKFVDLSGSPVDSTGLPDNTVYVTGSYTASGIPASHTVAGGDTYTYIGYKLDSYTAGDTLASGTPSAVAITSNRDVYYVYSNFADLTISKTVTGAYADLTKAFTFTVYFQDGSGMPLAGGTQFTYTGGASPSGGTLTLDGDGKATFTLSHGQTITIAGVSTSGRVRIVETVDPNYTASFKDSLDAAPTSGSDTGVRSMTAADRTIDFANARNAIVPAGASTGGNALIWLPIMALLAAMAGLAIKAVYRRRAGRS